MAETRAQLNRAVRQKAMREQLAAKGLVQHVLDISTKLADPAEELDAGQVTRLKHAADLQMGLIKKYLPDLKPVLEAVQFQFDPEANAAQKVNALMDAVSKGDISADVAAILINSVKQSVDIEAATDLKDRIEKLEELLGAQSR